MTNEHQTPPTESPSRPASPGARGGFPNTALFDVMGALLAAARDSCTCKACQILRRIADTIADELTAEKPAERPAS